MDIKINEGEYRDCEVTIPTSKSLSHRFLIAASFYDGISHLKNVVMNKDTQATMNVLSSLGVQFKIDGNDITVKGIKDYSKFNGQILDCNESGSTLRFLIPIFALMNQDVTFTGHGRLMQRPLTVYEQLFKQQGLLFEQTDQYLHIKGPLHSGNFNIDGNISSQFITGLLYALSLCEGDSTITINPPYESRSYVLLSEDVLNRAGANIIDNGNMIHIKGCQKLHDLSISVDGDDSQGVFFGCLANIRNINVKVNGLNHKSKQGDHVFIDLLKQMGCKVNEESDGYTFSPASLKPICIDLKDCPDLGPALFALATTIKGKTTFINASRLRIKESDRIECMQQELSKLGVHMASTYDNVEIDGGYPLNSNVILDGHNDHRIVMALSILCSKTNGCIIQGAQAIEKSYPDFFRDLKKCHVEVIEI